MTGTFLIRGFQTDDLADLQNIRAVAFQPVFRSLRALLGDEVARFAMMSAETEQAKLLDGLCAAGSQSRVYVATLNGKPVGFVSVTLDEATKVGEIGLNAVHPDFAGRGIGSELLGFALQDMRNAGMAVAAVSTGSDESHAPARRAYDKAGFGPTIHTQWMYRVL
jgi:ribosomal protein S18 acetylase RimI-like enzyme